MNRTLVILKPDAVERGLVGELLRRLEAKGLRFVDGGFRCIDAELARAHYAEHSSQPFFSNLVTFITRSPSFVAVLEGPEETWRVVRTLMGPTDPLEAPPGTIRGDLAIKLGENLIHGSDSATAAEREIALFFPHLA
jgi:nucleoside-diphosphate kinase